MKKKIDHNLHLLTESHPEACNVYMIDCGQSMVFIDTGLFSQELAAYAEYSRAIITHAHLDHVGNNYLFNEVYMHPLAEQKIRDVRMMQDFVVDFETEKAVPRNKYTGVEDGEVLVFGDHSLEVIYTPGHTKDSISLYEPSRKWLFTGDTWYRGGFCVVDDSDIEEWKESIKLLQTYDAELILGGHGEVANSIAGNIESLFAEKNLVRL